jgi:putative transport protein
MAGSALVLVVVGAGTVLLGRLLGISAGFQGGALAGVGTSTPTLAAATAAVGGGTEPAVGYAVHLELGRRRVTPRDPGSAAVAGLTDLTVVVGRRARLAEVPGAGEELVRFSFWRHGRSVEVAGGDAVAEPGDQVVVVGGQEAVAFATGRVADERVNEGYATLFALDTILKVLLVQVIVGVG